MLLSPQALLISGLPSNGQLSLDKGQKGVLFKKFHHQTNSCFALPCHTTICCCCCVTTNLLSLDHNKSTLVWISKKRIPSSRVSKARLSLGSDASLIGFSSFRIIETPNSQVASVIAGSWLFTSFCASAACTCDCNCNWQWAASG